MALLITFPFSGALLPVPQRRGEEGAPYVQCSEEEGSTGERNVKAAASQSSEQRLWARKLKVPHDTGF